METTKTPTEVNALLKSPEKDKKEDPETMNLDDIQSPER